MNPKYIAVGALAFAIIGLAYLQMNVKKEANDHNPNVPQPTAMTETSVVTTDAPMGTYKDGSYEATGHYMTPGGPQTVGVKVTLKAGAVSAADVTVEGTNKTSKLMQGKFAGAYKQFVVGKPIDEIALDVVGGSSLTPKGFQDALDQIKKEASA